MTAKNVHTAIRGPSNHPERTVRMNLYAVNALVPKLQTARIPEDRRDLVDGLGDQTDA